MLLCVNLLFNSQESTQSEGQAFLLTLRRSRFLSVEPVFLLQIGIFQIPSIRKRPFIEMAHSFLPTQTVHYVSGLPRHLRSIGQLFRCFPGLAVVFVTCWGGTFPEMMNKLTIQRQGKKKPVSWLWCILGTSLSQQSRLLCSLFCWWLWEGKISQKFKPFVTECEVKMTMKHKEQVGQI